jgi:DNA-binding winged helix-turn-helix (wHTH) protein
MTLAFADFELDEGHRELRRGGSLVSLEPKPFSVLCHLVRGRERVVSKRELLETAWPDVAVAESSLGCAIRSVRRALGDTASEQRFVRTLWRRGFRFVAPVEERLVEAPRVTSATAAGSVPFRRAAVASKLERALADASAGHGRIVLLTGEPGIGKTRTAEKLAEWAAKRSARLLASSGQTTQSGVPYGSWLGILRSLVDLTDDASLRGRLRGAAVELAGLIPELRIRVPDLAEPAAGSPDDLRFRLLDAVASLLRAAGSDRPLVLILDDIQSADRSSLRLLEFMAREIAASRVVLLIAAPDVAMEPADPIEQTLAELARSSGFEQI